jgi:hypothetical protein
MRGWGGERGKERSGRGTFSAGRETTLSRALSPLVSASITPPCTLTDPSSVQATSSEEARMEVGVVEGRAQRRRQAAAVVDASERRERWTGMGGEERDRACLSGRGGTRSGARVHCPSLPRGVRWRAAGLRKTRARAPGERTKKGVVGGQSRGWWSVAFSTLALPGPHPPTSLLLLLAAPHRMLHRMLTSSALKPGVRVSEGGRALWGSSTQKMRAERRTHGALIFFCSSPLAPTPRARAGHHKPRADITSWGVPPSHQTRMEPWQ